MSGLFERFGIAWPSYSDWVAAAVAVALVAAAWGRGQRPLRILNRVWKLCRENRIDLPFPQRDLHIKDWPGMPGAG